MGAAGFCSAATALLSSAFALRKARRKARLAPAALRNNPHLAKMIDQLSRDAPIRSSKTANGMGFAGLNSSLNLSCRTKAIMIKFYYDHR